MAKRIPKQTRSRKKVEAIIQATRQIIAEDRFTETSTHKIAKRAGVGVGSVYEYFDSKEDILLSLLDYEAREIWHQVESRIPAWMNMDKTAALEELVQFSVDIAIENRGLTKVIFAQVPGLMSTEPIVRLMTQVEMLIKLLLRVEDATANPARDDTNAFIFMNTLIGLLLGIANGLPVTVTQELVAERLSRILDLLFDNLDVLQ